jgi:tripartite ATP-independent transporter DctM subunit
VAIYVRVNPDAAQSAPRVRYGERLLNLLKTWPVIAVFSIVIGGIYLGIFTPTEAAAIGTALTGAYAVIVGRCNAVDFIQCLINTAHTTAMIFLIVLSATVFNSFLAFTQTPAQLAAWVTDSGLTPFTVLMLMLLTYLLLGCVMDSLSMILLTIPVFFPIIIALDFGMTPEETAIWFGVLVLIVVEVGLITPPVGMNLFVINALARDTPLRSTYMGVLPFVAADMVRVVVLIALPPITLGLVWAIF